MDAEVSETSQQKQAFCKPQQIFQLNQGVDIATQLVVTEVQGHSDMESQILTKRNSTQEEQQEDENQAILSNNKLDESNEENQTEQHLQNSHLGVLKQNYEETIQLKNKNIEQSDKDLSLKYGSNSYQENYNLFQTYDTNFNLKRNLLFTPKDLKSQAMYSYDMPPNLDAIQDSSNYTQNQFISQSPTDLTLSQLTSKSYFINSIMKKNSKELIKQQKELEDIVLQQNQQKRNGFTKNEKIQQKMIKNFQNHQTNMKDNYFQIYEQNQPKKQKKFNLQSFDNSKFQVWMNQNQTSNSSREDLSEQKSKKLAIYKDKAKNKSQLIQLTPILEKSNKQAQSQKIFNIFSNKQDILKHKQNISSNEISKGQIEYAKQQKQQERNQLPLVTQSFSNQNNFSLDHQKQINFFQQTSKQPIKQIQSSKINSTINQQLKNNSFQEIQNTKTKTSSKNQEKLNNILKVNVTNNPQYKQKKLIYFSKTENSDRSNDGDDQFSIFENQNNVDSAYSQSKEVNSLRQIKKNDLIFEQIQIDQRENKEIQFRIKKEQKNNNHQQKQIETFQNNQVNKPIIFEINKQLNLINASENKLNQQNEQNQLFQKEQSYEINEKINLDTPKNNHLKISQSEDGKWKIENSDNMDMEASRSSSMNQNKINFRKQSSQLSPSVFSINTHNTLLNQNVIDNSNNNNEINKQFSITKKRSLSDNSLDDIKLQYSVEIHHIKSSENLKNQQTNNQDQNYKQQRQVSIQQNDRSLNDIPLNQNTSTSIISQKNIEINSNNIQQSHFQNKSSDIFNELPTNRISSLKYIDNQYEKYSQNEQIQLQKQQSQQQQQRDYQIISINSQSVNNQTNPNQGSLEKNVKNNNQEQNNFNKENENVKIVLKIIESSANSDSTNVEQQVQNKLSQNLENVNKNSHTTEYCQDQDILQQQDQMKNEKIDFSMTTVQEKSEATSNKSIHINQNEFSTLQRRKSNPTLKNYQIPDSSNAMQNQNIKEDQSVQSTKKLSISQSALNEVKDEEEITSKSSIDGNLKFDENKKLNKEEQIILYDSMQNIFPQQLSNISLNIDQDQICNQQSDKTIKINSSAQLLDKEKQQFRMRSETFKGKQQAELYINVMPPDNNTPQSIQNIQEVQNFSQLNRNFENGTDKSNEIKLFSSQNLQDDKSEQEYKQLQIQIDKCKQQSQTFSSKNLDEISQGGSKKNIPLINNLQIQSINNKDNQIDFNLKLQQKLNIEKNTNYQKLNRFVQSSDDQLDNHSYWDENDKNQRTEQQSNTTKHSQRKNTNQNDSPHSSFNQEQDSPALSLKKQLQSRKITQIQSNNSLQHEEYQKISQKTSIDNNNSRRSSLLTPQQIKQAKKESRFQTRLSNFNQQFFEAEDSLILNIYGQETDKQIQLNGLCNFNENQSINQGFKTDLEVSQNNAVTSENDQINQSINANAHQKDSSMKKLINQIECFQQNPYLESFDSNKGNNMFQKNVKTLFRKINQYFKTKYHQENFGFDGSKSTDTKNGQQEGNQNKIQQNIPRISLQNGFAVASEKLIWKGKNSIQSDLGQSEDLEQEEKQINQNIELKKSDIEKLNQRLQRNSKVPDKFNNQKAEDTPSQREIIVGLDKQSTLDRVNGFVRNSKKKQSQKLVIQINPPADEPTQIQIPHIKLDFSAIKKKNGNTEFVLNQNNNKEAESLESSNEDEDEMDDLKNDSQVPNNFGYNNEYIEKHSSQVLDFLNQSGSSWDEQEFNSQFIPSEQNQAKLLNKMHKISIRKIDSYIKDRHNKLSLVSEQSQEQKLSTLKFLDQNSWRFVKNYQITYLEKQIDKDFFFKVSRLRNVLKNIKSKVDPSDRFKLDSIIALNQTNINAGEIFLQKDRAVESKASKVMQQSICLSDSRENESYDFYNKDPYEHQFQEDLVSEQFLDDKKRKKDECSQESSSDESFTSESSDEVEEVEMEEYYPISDQDKDLNDRTQFLYDEEDYEGGRSSYQLNEGYLEPVMTNESSNMFTQLYEEIQPVLSGIENDQINDILKTRKNDKKAHQEIIQQSQIEKKFKTINKMVAQLDIKSSQTDMRNIQSEYNELLEGDFQDNQRIDHDFFRKDFLKQQQNQFNKFVNNYKYFKGKLIQNQQKKSNLDSSVIGIGSSTLGLPLNRQNLKEKSPKSIADNNLEIVSLNKYKRQDSKNSQHQNFQQSFNLYNQQQQQHSTLSTQPGSLQQQQMQIQPTYAQQYYQQSHLLQHQFNTLQQNASPQQNNFIQNNTLPTHHVHYNTVSPSNQNANQQQKQSFSSGVDTNLYTGSFMKNIQNRGFTQSLKNFSSIPNRGEGTSKNQITIKAEDDPKAFKNIQKINIHQQQISEIYPSYSSIQGGSYNKTSTLQSQQSAFNQSDSLHNKEILNQENSKQPIKNQENQVFSLQKVSTNQSADENQLTAPSPTQISIKKDLRSTGRKRSIFNTENSQSQPNIAIDLNKNHHTPPQLHSPIFANNQNQGNSQFGQRVSNQFKNNYFFQQPQPVNNLTPQLQISHQASLIQRQSIGSNQTQNPTYYTNLQQQQQQQYQSQQINTAIQLTSPSDIIQSPYRQPARTGTLNSYGSLNSQNNQNGMSNQLTLQTQMQNQINTPTNNQISQIIGSGKVQTNALGAQLNFNQQGLVNQYQINNSRLQINTEAQTPHKLALFSSFSVKKDIEKATSMDRQNLVMRTKLQQSIRKSQLSQKDQVFAAIKENNIHEIEDLLNQYHTLSLESKDDEGNTFIIIAAQVGSKEIVEYLFQKGADINASNNEGDTALHKANFYKYHNVADFLIQKGALQNKANNIGLNPWASYNQPKR
ncbi:hypothetical protein TTHERM_00455190 (macronuclear) [Tetrahymena thermophila SB210]|uniref:Uncharacterized protein n=1 Tax=Tetrahymena thermophila (strain SB210) TaxID=312017 RepID=I7M3Q1_TETTS|nr:hypothetical protein TTHERM_00455190 [Tetrahymena thermophila SB210]EAS03880.2 hypothetical protein TTHERM_00455190 [Tetrahymena thermophila SB210]|eukprot:XP_001024125.2 hypothetical protein TTHERM_00455190 [Tetrahymena thermophila SB210]